MLTHTTHPTPKANPALKALFLVAGAFMTFVMIGGGTLAIVSGLAHTSETSTVAFQATGSSGVRHVRIQADSGTIVLRGSDRADVTGRRVVSRGLQSPSVAEHSGDDELVLESHCPAVGSAWCGVSYTLDIPRNASVDIDSSAGSAHVSDIDGDVRLSSSAGELAVDNVSGTVAIDTSAGSVRGTALASKNVTATSSAGEVHLEFAVAPDRVETRLSAGDLTVLVPNDGTRYRVDAHTSLGDSKTTVPTDPRSPHVITATSSAGSVRVATR